MAGRDCCEVDDDHHRVFAAIYNGHEEKAIELAATTDIVFKYPNKVDVNTNETILLAAIRAGMEELAFLIVSNSRKVSFVLYSNDHYRDRADLPWETALHAACRMGMSGVATLIIEKWDIGKCVYLTSNGHSYLYLSERAGMYEVSELLVGVVVGRLEKNPSDEYRDSSHCWYNIVLDSFVWACKNAREDMAVFLLGVIRAPGKCHPMVPGKGHPMNRRPDLLKDPSGRTSLHFARENNLESVVKALTPPS